MNPLLQILTNLAQTTNRFLPSFQSQQDFEALMFRYGWLVDLEDDLDNLTLIPDLAEAFKAFGDKARKWIEDDQEDSESEVEDKKEKDWKDHLKALYELAKPIYKIILKLKELKQDDIDGFGQPLSSGEFWNEIPERLIEDIFTLTLQRHYPIAYGFLHIFGIIEYIEEEPAGDDRVNYTRTNIDWSRLGEFVSGPSELFKEVYSWDKVVNYKNEPNFKSRDFQWEKLLHTLERIFLSNRFLARYILPRKSVVEGFTKPKEDFPKYEEWVFANELHELQIPFIYGTSILDESFYNIGLGIMPIGRKSANGKFDKAPDGILITPVLQGGLSHSFFITPEIALQLNLAADAKNVIAAKIFPDQVEFPVQVPAGGISANLVGSPYEPWTIFGDRDSHRLEIHGFDLGMSVITDGDDSEVKLSFKATTAEPESRGIQAVIHLGESDSFIQETIGEKDSDNIEIGFDLEIEWSSKHGFRFGGSAELEYEAALNFSIGFLEVTNLYFSLKAGDAIESTAQLRTALGLRGELGPIRFFIENMGFALDLNTYKTEELKGMAEDKRPALGMMDFELGFTPPKGIGIVIDTPAVKGGGYLEFQDTRYIGSAELTIVDTISLKAIAVIDTKLPDGKEGYSFLIIITGEFSPIQLGFGFTLRKVGGMVGIHRSMSIDAIREKVKSDEFDKVLFSDDPIGNIQSIVASLDEIFPIQEGQYTFGVMGELGWGSPNIIDIKAGLLIQVPNFKLAIVGTAKSEIIRTSIPEKEGEKPEETVLLRIQISFAGWYDEQKSLFGFDASLYNSEILGLPLQGDAALRLRGGDDPYFMMSVGGFHPDFEPPKGLGLGKLKRIELPLSAESLDIDLSAEFYCAVTSNTVQFGARARAYYSCFAFDIEGKVGFDALFQFSPILFKVEAWGKVTIYVWGSSWGLRIRGSIEGPYPFKFNLYVTIDLGWLGSYDFGIPEFTIGKEAQVEKPKIDVLEELRVVLDDHRMWEPVLPERNELLVALRDATAELTTAENEKEEEEQLIFHPIGGLKIDQDRVPLHVPIEKFGHNQPEVHNYFSIEINDEEANLKRFFPPAQFYEMNQEEKLASNSYEKMSSGIQLVGFDEIEIPTRVLQKQVSYETGYYDPKSETPESATVDMENAVFEQYALNNSIGKSSLGKKTQQRMEGDVLDSIYYDPSAHDPDDEFVIIHQGGDADFVEIKTSSESAAQKLLDQLIDENPGLEDDLVVVPIYETV